MSEYKLLFQPLHKCLTLDKIKASFTLFSLNRHFQADIFVLSTTWGDAPSSILSARWAGFPKFLSCTQIEILNNEINKIKINKSLNINNPLYSHYDNAIFYKKLQASMLKNNENANKVPVDVLEYIIKTSFGQFWDDFTSTFKSNGLLRSEVKETLFREVFYSKTINTRYKKFAKVFKAKYPTVYQLINEYKPNEDRKQLSNLMMKLESEIFHKILERLYKKRGCNILTIHDAIVMLDTKGSRKYQHDEIEKVMREVYQEYNLNPTISIETFNPLQWKAELEEQMTNQPMIDEYIEELKSYAANPDNENHEAAKGILQLIEDGRTEIIIEKEEIKFHSLNSKK